MTQHGEGVEATPNDEPRAPSGSRGRVVGAIALTVIVAAGVVISRNIPPWPWFPPSAPEAAPQQAAAPTGPSTPDGPDPADVTSLIRIARADDGTATVAMARPRATTNIQQIQGTDQDLLFRELVRQAVLLAARDERGAATRDQLLDDAAPAEEDAPAAEVGSLFRVGFRARLLIRPTSGGIADVEAEPLLSADLAPRSSQGFGLEIVGPLEELSRTGIPAALDGLGVRGTPNAYRPDAPAPAGVEDNLNTLGFVEHVQALRQLHAAIRTDGESPARLEALARAYAQLGALSVHHWSTAHRAFEARSLLYAERLVVKDARSPRSLQTRAFVKALAGVHNAAIKDLEEAARTASGPTPAWVTVIDDYVHYRLPNLSTARPPHDRLAALLRMAALEFPGGSRQLIRAAEDVIRIDPDCPRAFDVICENGGLGDLHKATVLGPQSFQEFLGGKLAAAKEVPTEIRKALDAGAGAVELDQTLDAAAGGEPSWGVLAHLCRETRFVQVQRRLFFMRRKWSVPVEEFWESASPVIANHPYRPFLGAVAGLPSEASAYAAFAAAYDRTDIEPTEGEFIGFIQHTPGPFQAAAQNDWNLAAAHTTASARDFSQVLKRTEGPMRPIHAARMMEVCPNDPYPASVLLLSQWEAVQPRLAEWKERYRDSAGFLFALTTKLLELQRHEEARPLLTHYIILSPDRWGYEKLAECQEKAGDEAGWQETLESYLENTEDAGLDHAGVRVKLAKKFLARGEAEKAKPLADAAAATWASWAMACAAEVDERLGDLDSAGEWRRRMAQRYPATWPQWYQFTARTGRGDLDGAKQVAKAMAARTDVLDPVTAGFIDWSDERPELALKRIAPTAEEFGDFATAIFAALLADQTGDPETRDAMMKLVVEHAERGPVTARIARMLFDSLAEGAPPADLEAIDALIAPMEPQPRSFCEFLVGRFLLNRGRREEAKPHLEYCVATTEMNDWSRAVAASWLRTAFPEPTPKSDDPEPKSKTAEPTRT